MDEAEQTILLKCPLCHKAEAKYFGRNVFKCAARCTTKFFKASVVDGELVQLGAQPASPSRTHHKTSHVEIKCIDCDAIRIIKIQDKFQVKRCIPCQKEHRNKSRKRRNDGPQ